MNKPELYGEYYFDKIEQFANNEKLEIEEHGNDVIGEALIILRNPNRDQVTSFIMTGANGAGMPSYKCVYSDSFGINNVIF